ncbi:MAG: stage V sporulation protein AD [Clostridiaceae bacterium]|nr:stage V sporulation protein AD [Clostridiaceae bacterium]
MAGKRLGNQTVRLETPPRIISTASIAGPKEGEGPLGHTFDLVLEDELWGEKTWEKAESKIVRETWSRILEKSGKAPEDINYIIAGDLLNQCIATTFGLRESSAPYLGVYGACSTMCESLSIGAMLVDGGFADNVVCLTSSHFCSAEKQFRFPLELGTQRAPTAQWTVLGCGAVLVSSHGQGPAITHVTTGKIVDKGIKDANNMGGAMAPAAADTIVSHFKDTGFTPDYYDLVLTGDLGIVGKAICDEMVGEQGFNISKKLKDCGLMIYDLNKQDVHAGASGCACSATVFAGHIYKEMLEGRIKKLLLVATGALLNPTSTQQGETIPSIAHAVTIEA